MTPSGFHNATFSWGVVVCLLLGGQPVAGNQVPGSPSSEAGEHGKVLRQYCVACHNDRTLKAGLTLEAADLDDVPDNAEVWEKVIRKLRTGGMPPAGRPRPDAETVDALATYLEDEVDQHLAQWPNPGRTEVVHRLNRTEYQNAVRDLLALDVDVAALLPADDQSYGFDNIAGVLKMSPTLFERYLSAAEEVSSLAVGASERAPVAHTVRLASDLSQYAQAEGLPFGTRGGAAIRHYFPRDGEYSIRAKLLDFVVGETSISEPHHLEIAVDGERVGVFELAPNVGKLAYHEKVPDSEVQVVIPAGPRVVSATFVKKTSALPEKVRQPFSRPHTEQDFLLYQPHISTVTITGPFNVAGMSNTPSRERIFVCHPSREAGADEERCAVEVLSTLARRAYRRPVTEEDVTALMAFYEEGRERMGFDLGIEMALQAILVSPDFLHRVESEPEDVVPNGVYEVGDLELASRLSFFLWSSIPDDELLDLAIQRRLRDPAVLEQQVLRMLKDPKAEALATTFAGQWLRLRNVSGVQPDNVTFPNFGENLRRDFVKETELFFDSIVREDRSVLELMTADYTFVNERLAKFYGIPYVYGNRFRRVATADENRRGLLGHGSVLLVTSYPDRTSAVVRGKWILENILGTPPPAPPPNVPALAENGDGVIERALSMRERMEMHRANPVCASCHSRMDPLGLAFENFDALGRWRTHDESGELVDASGVTSDGRQFNGPAALRDLLVSDPEQFVTVVTEKLLIYALGRGLEHYDASTIRQVVRKAAARDYSFSSVVVGLVQSPPFTKRAVLQSAESARASRSNPRSGALLLAAGETR